MSDTMEQQLRRAHTTTDRETMIEGGLLWRAADELRSKDYEIANLTKRLDDAWAEIKRLTTPPQPAAAPAAPPEREGAETVGKRAFTLAQVVGHVDGNLKNWECATSAKLKDNYLSYVLNDITDALQMISERLAEKGTVQS